MLHHSVGFFPDKDLDFDDCDNDITNWYKTL